MSSSMSRSAGDRTQSIRHAKKALYPSAMFPAMIVPFVSLLVNDCGLSSQPSTQRCFSLIGPLSSGPELVHLFVLLTLFRRTSGPGELFLRITPYFSQGCWKVWWLIAMRRWHRKNTHSEETTTCLMCDSYGEMGLILCSFLFCNVISYANYMYFSVAYTYFRQIM